MTAKPNPDAEHPAVRNSPGFDRISIQNYRGIANLEIKSLSQINLIFGDSNSGKTAVLEAAFMLAAPRMMDLIVRVDNSRGVSWESLSDAILPFHGLSFSEPIRLLGTLAESNEYRETVIGPLSSNRYPRTLILERTDRESKPPFPINDRGLTTEPINGLELHFTVCGSGDERKFKRYMVFNDKQIDFEDGEGEGDYEESLNATFLHPSREYSIENIDECFRKKKKGLLVDSLREVFNEPIRDMDVDPRGLLFLDVDGPERQIPLNFMGAGLRRALDMLATVHGRQDDIILIDEFETGFFHRSLDKFWRPFFRAIEESCAQVFLTFHSEDVLASLAEHFINGKGSPASKEKVALFNLRKYRNGAMHRAYRYTVDDVIHGLREGLELRD